MEKYNYREAITSDIRYAIECKEVLTPTDYPDRDTAFEAIYDLLWLNDGVTGNASGSYWCNAWKAEEAICHNLDLLKEANNEFCSEFSESAEYNDVTIRCYLLSECLGDVLDTYEWNDEDNENED